MENRNASNPSETQISGFLSFSNKNRNVISSEQNGNDLLDNPECFYDRLFQLHESSGLNLVVDIRQTLLDLHVFYKEVVKRGGFWQVNRERKWEEVALALKLERIDPKYACRLQNNYALFLYQFEQMFFYRSHEATKALDSAGHACHVENSSAMKQGSLEASDQKFTDRQIVPVANKNKASNCDPVSKVGIPKETKVLSPWTPSKSKEMKKRQGGYPGTSKSKEMKNNPGGYPGTSKNKEMKNRPGGYPGRQTGYSIFLKQECDRLKKIHGKSSGGKNFRLMAIDAWRLLPENDRQHYVEESKIYKKRFLEEMLNASTEHHNMQATNIEKLPVCDKSDGYYRVTPQTNDENLAEPDKSAVDFANEIMKNVSDDSMLPTGWDKCENQSLDAHN